MYFVYIRFFFFTEHNHFEIHACCFKAHRIQFLETSTDTAERQTYIFKMGHSLIKANTVDLMTMLKTNENAILNNTKSLRLKIRLPQTLILTQGQIRQLGVHFL